MLSISRTNSLLEHLPPLLAEAGPPQPSPAQSSLTLLLQRLEQPRRDATGPASGMQLEPHGRFFPG